MKYLILLLALAPLATAANQPVRCNITVGSIYGDVPYKEIPMQMDLQALEGYAIAYPTTTRLDEIKPKLEVWAMVWMKNDDEKPFHSLIMARYRDPRKPRQFIELAANQDRSASLKDVHTKAILLADGKNGLKEGLIFSLVCK